jgi:hypothetical protein
MQGGADVTPTSASKSKSGETKKKSKMAEYEAEADKENCVPEWQVPKKSEEEDVKKDAKPSSVMPAGESSDEEVQEASGDSFDYA